MARRSYVVLLVSLLCVIVPATRADVNLVITHSNDLWFQLDEIHSDNTPCYKPLPPRTTTSIPTTTTVATTTSSPSQQTTATNATAAETTTVPITISTSANTTEAPTTETSTVPTETNVTPESITTEVSSPTAATNVTDERQKRFARADDTCYGGVARHLAKTKELKTAAEQNNKIFLNLNAGGMLGGYIWYPILGYEPAVETIRMLNFNAVGLGYRDFDEGVNVAADYIKKLNQDNIDVLCANMDISQEVSMQGVLIKKSKIVEIKGLKIGIIGYIGQDADYMADTGKIRFTDPVSAIENETTILLSQSVKFIIALGSAGLSEATNLLEKLYNVDLIINGGGPDRLLYNAQSGNGPLGEKIAGPYPITSDSQNVKRGLVQTSRLGKYLGKIEMVVDNNGRIKEFVQGNNPVLLSETVTPDPELQDKVDEWERIVVEQTTEVIGYTKVPIYSERTICWYFECNGASLMADAAQWYFTQNATATESWPNTVAATVWHGGALSDTDLDIAPGNITFGDILYMFPFANTLAIATMKGSDVKQLFEKSIENYNDSSVRNLGEFLHVSSGIRVDYDLSKPKGSRVVRLDIRDTSSPKGDVLPIKDNTMYKIGMPSFIAKGGSAFSFMETIASIDKGIRDEEVLKHFIKHRSPLAHANEGRVQFVSVPTNDNCTQTNVVGTVFLTIFLTLLCVAFIFFAYKYLYPKIRERRGSLMSLVR